MIIEENSVQPVVTESKRKLVFLFVFVTFLIIALGIIGFLAYQNYQLQQKITQNTTSSVPPETAPTIIPTSVADPTANWKTYTDNTLGFEFKYPNNYNPVTSSINGQIDNNRIDFEANSASYLSLIKQNLITYDEKNLCSPNTKVYPCIHATGSNQKTPVTMIRLGEKSAKSYYVAVAGGPDNDYHIVQTNESPLIELRMYISGGGLDQKFDQILSTLKFLDQTVNTSNWKTYTNNTFGFLVEYNSTFNPSESTDGIQQLALIGFGSMKNNGFDIEVTTGDTIGYYKNRITDQGEKIDKEEKVIVDGTSATKLTFKQVIVIDKLDISKIIITKNNRDYIITALASDIDQILSTFEFVD